jgi:hypothetical protein
VCGDLAPIFYAVSVVRGKLWAVPAWDCWARSFDERKF